MTGALSGLSRWDGGGGGCQTESARASCIKRRRDGMTSCLPSGVFKLRNPLFKKPPLVCPEKFSVEGPKNFGILKFAETSKNEGFSDF